jgi:membrane peptidoglycan carboxypeptidase
VFILFFDIIFSMIKKKKKNAWRVKPIGKKKKGNKIINFKKLLIFVFLITLMASILFFASLAWLSNSLPHPDKLLQRNIAQSTKIYDRTGKIILYEIFNEQRRTLVKLSDIPDHLINATLVTEDKDFFKHPGFDLKAIIRSVFIDILRGGKAQGGSTLTQQFIKNAFLTKQKTYQRKIKELILAYQIEKKYSKEEILQMYFNEIPYGSTAYGAEAASQLYFGKSVRDLTLDESSLLAAMVQSPTYYSPTGDHQDELILRRNNILGAMVENGYLTREMAEMAKQADTLKKIVSRHENIIAPHFIMYVKELLTEKYGERLVEQGGLKVITTIDVNKQKTAEETIDKFAEKNEKIFKATNAALVSLDVATGQVLAMIGSKDFFNKDIDGQVNIALRPRQPGSSFKPIVYAAAFEKGFTPETILFDVETNFGSSSDTNKNYIPQNYNGEFYGPVSMRQSLAGSLNIPGVKTLYLVGLKQSLDLAQRMGYTTLTDENRYGLSLVLGGGEVKLLEHVSAFSIFAREGKKLPITTILKVENSEGKILEENDVNLLSHQEILNPQTARLINNILSDNQARAFVFGQENYLTLPDRPVAAKTGTTNNFRDAWIVGYTPDLVTGVWVGNSRNETMANKADGSQVAAPIWREFMSQVLSQTPVKTFTPPEPIETNKPILKGILPDEVVLEIDRTSGKLATEMTPVSQKIQKTFKGYYPILYYVNKDNPLGPMPENPSLDPQYERWQEGIKNWLKTQQGNLDIPPSEYDDIHVPANQPLVEILFPFNDAVIDEQLFEVKIDAQAPRGIAKIICYVDNIPLALAPMSPEKQTSYYCSLNISGIKSGEHNLAVTASDDAENSQTKTIKIRTTQFFKETISWLNPQNNWTMSQNDFPLNLKILAPAKKIKKIKFFSRNLTTLNASLIGTVFSPEASGPIEFSWSMVDQGEHEIWAELIDEDNQTLVGETIKIKVD